MQKLKIFTDLHWTSDVSGGSPRFFVFCFFVFSLMQTRRKCETEAPVAFRDGRSEERRRRQGRARVRTADAKEGKKRKKITHALWWWRRWWWWCARARPPSVPESHHSSKVHREEKTRARVQATGQGLHARAGGLVLPAPSTPPLPGLHE